VAVDNWLNRAAIGEAEIDFGNEGKMTVREWESRHPGVDR
jgi:hypothetical protein